MGHRNAVAPIVNPTKKNKIQPINPADCWTGHALDGSQQLDILEEQLYVNEPGTAIDQPLVPLKPST